MKYKNHIEIYIKKLIYKTFKVKNWNENKRKK